MDRQKLFQEISPFYIKQMKKIWIIFVCFGSIGSSFGQDVHFSQTAQTPLLINPAAAGVFDGWERIIINHRNQWLGASTQFMTTNIAADVNFGKSKRNDKAHLGLGVQFYNDIGGDAKFGTQYGSLTLSGILPMADGHILSAGIQGGFGNRKGDISRLSFMSQWNGTQFDQTILSGEANALNTFTYADVSGGLYYVFDGGQKSFKRDADFKLQLGVSGYHLNQPKMKYITVDGDRMYRKFAFHAGFLKEFVGSKWSINASALQFIQGPHLETILGGMLQHRFQDGTKITGNSQDAFFGFGAYFRVKDAVVPSVMVEYKGFKFGLSYDITISKLARAYKGGSLEFSLSFTNYDHSLFKGRRGRSARMRYKG